MLSNTPMAAIADTSAEPPNEMNGSGTPVNGTVAVTTAMFTNA